MKTFFVLFVSAALLTGSSIPNATGAASNATTNQATGSSTTNSNSQGSPANQTATISTNQFSFDQAFVRLATKDSLKEVTLGELAQTNSQNAVVQDFGVLLITDHSLALAQLQDLADELGIALPTTLNSIQQQQVQTLTTLTGDSFDLAFDNVMINSHIFDIGLFSAAARQATNADLQAFSQDQLPILIEHLLIAQAIREDLLAAQAAGTSP